MEVILLQKVANLGNLGDRVSVKRGYGRNFLIPHGKATEATSANIAHFEARRAELERLSAETQSQAESRRDQLADLVVTLAVKAGNEGRLFGSVGAADVAAAVSAMGVELKRQEVRLPEGPIRQIGEYDVPVHLHTDVDAHIHVNVVAE
jgi:large subunit ribosomal protein L9